MAHIKIFENQKFGKIRTVDIEGEPWFVGKDVAVALGYSNASKAIIAHVNDDDKRFEMMLVSDSQNGNLVKTALINESGLYSLILSSKLPSAREFKHWVTSKVLPSIRKTGGYALPKDYPSALRALADSVEQLNALAAENEQQRQTIADFAPIKQYVDTILESRASLATSQVAADYDLSAQALNKILHEEGIQHCVNGQWLLYRKHMGQGYTKSKTISITRSDGTPDTKMHTQWTQKGRMMIHRILEKRGIKAVMDKAGTAE